MIKKKNNNPSKRTDLEFYKFNENNNKKINYYKLLAVFAITTLIFISGILIGNYFTEKKLSKINELEKEIRTDIEATELQYILLSENLCSIDFDFLTKELEETGSKLTYMENMLGFDNPNVLDLKETYSLIQLRHYLLLKKFSKECNGVFNFIIYFYSNKGDCPKCEQQGFILDYIKKKYSNTMIYSFDINNNNPAVKTIKLSYNINNVPTVIINDIVFQKFMSVEEIELSLLNTES